MKLELLVVLMMILVLCIPAFAQTTVQGIDRRERNGRLDGLQDLGGGYASHVNSESAPGRHECPSGMFYVDKIAFIL